MPSPGHCAWSCTGEAEEDRVEEVAGRSAVHEHEEAAERFLVLSGAMLLLSGIGLASGKVGSVARIGATAGSVGLLLAGIQVGGSGGDLVYRHNAASVYAAEEVVGAGVASRPSPAGTDVNGSR